LTGARVETSWVPGAFQLWVGGSQRAPGPPPRVGPGGSAPRAWRRARPALPPPRPPRARGAGGGAGARQRPRPRPSSRPRPRSSPPKPGTLTRIRVDKSNPNSNHKMSSFYGRRKLKGAKGLGTVYARSVRRECSEPIACIITNPPCLSPSLWLSPPGCAAGWPPRAVAACRAPPRACAPRPTAARPPPPPPPPPPAAAATR
jgi:hypothetical protein